ncbi:MAG: penicillin-binding protein 1C [Bacteroidota bacterium]|nr:penicillin-binding protein 1C [Bacteroidota bacterium]MDX5505550.1 penicillin-binding protein 1C [Bacteroidota bacterium]
MGKRWTRLNRPFLIGFAVGLFFWWWNCLPDPFFEEPYATVVLSREGQLLGARLSSDEQWRFPPGDSIPHHFSKALITFEDKRFFDHLGVDPLALLRAIRDNFRSGRIVSGGSTLTMQTIRLMRSNPDRNLFEKWKEIWMALRLELACSKDEILALYTAHAPFGGNVVGLEAASWRYFGRPPHLLSEAEAASLAILPNAPSLILPGRNGNAYKQKRDRLLNRMAESGSLSKTRRDLSILEPLPGKPVDLPMNAYHLTSRLHRKEPGRAYLTTIDMDIQNLVSDIASRHSRDQSASGIYNIGVLVADVRSGEVTAYIGNSPGLYEHEGHVDMISARRSSGSILKPFLYAALYDEGTINPRTLVPDIPVYLNGFYPENFDKEYRGAIPAGEALARSLNIPSVLLLRDFGVDRFLKTLHNMGFTTLDRSSDDYGLSLILGGGEVTLWELGGAYAQLTRVSRHFAETSGKYYRSDLHGLTLFTSNEKDSEPSLQPYGLGAGAQYLVLKDLQEVSRPDEMLAWESFGSGRIAWKTGTSFGFRDAWAVGTDGDKVVAVWVGNADGEGRPGLIGTRVAGPVLFEVFRSLGTRSSINLPQNDLIPQLICRESGFLMGQDCPSGDTLLLPTRAVNVGTCPWHRTILVDETQMLRYNGDCLPKDGNFKRKVWFDLPPAMSHFYERSHPRDPLPPLSPQCLSEKAPMEMIYPRDLQRIALPLDRNGMMSEAIFEVAHRVDDAIIYWYVDEHFLGTTRQDHKMSIQEIPGDHQLVIIDDAGNELKVPFKVIQTRP